MTDAEAEQIVNASTDLAQTLCATVIHKARELGLSPVESVTFVSTALAQCVTALLAGALKNEAVQSSTYDFLLDQFVESLAVFAAAVRDGAAARPADDWQ